MMKDFYEYVDIKDLYEGAFVTVCKSYPSTVCRHFQITKKGFYKAVARAFTNKEPSNDQ